MEEAYQENSNEVNKWEVTKWVNVGWEIFASGFIERKIELFYNVNRHKLLQVRWLRECDVIFAIQNLTVAVHPKRVWAQNHRKIGGNKNQLDRKHERVNERVQVRE